ncbi:MULTISPECIES: DUF2058 domain-containing protein [Stenotrophomonas]|uniref:Nucleoprotein/polynucleotide-associated enzyme n=2 Tax=Stenotrophomonas nitritireducens TaxID=83617 RepID=A0ABR5NKI5_9GAMM|nr:DUF2058 family protein [Stenotrophomonas sp. Leaf70]KQO02456.1 nucleoprotein/polynucleotide-associated enzyme [Stenotrophomonas sp. Leaf70]KRG57675.1 nucleoprotein/polynucleotide-associated enzyme [Stenotrophomonas nitritireducens]
MSDTLRDQLLGLGFKPAPKPERKPETRRDGRPQGKPGQARPQAGNKPGNKPGHAGKPAHGNKPAHAGPQGPRKPRSQEDIDLAKAYAIRAQREKDERIEAERQKQEEARLRREAKARLDELLKDKALNVADADIARHFPYGGKIKRIYVTADQLKALNAGQLGVLQQNGRYLLVTAELLAEAEAVFAPAVALKIDPDAPAEADPYADPMYQVPDDLVW